MVYRFVVLSDEDEAFVREFEFLDSHSLLDFHNALQDELEFDRSQIASFFMATESWEKEEEFTLFDMGAGSSTMENAVLEEVIFRKNQKLLYVFDFFNDRALFVEYVGEFREEDDKEYPVCINSKGLPRNRLPSVVWHERNTITSSSPMMKMMTVLTVMLLTMKSSSRAKTRRICRNSTTSKTWKRRKRIKLSPRFIR